MSGKHFPRLIALVLALTGPTQLAQAETLHLEPVAIPEWKAVYGRVEARDTVPARARIGGIVVNLHVSEGDTVSMGDVIATVRDDKIDFQIAALDAQLKGLKASLENARSELSRGEELIKRGVTTAQRLDALRTQVDIVTNQIGSTEAQRAVVVQQGREGAVLAPVGGKILNVPVTRGAVIMAGETIATIGGSGFFLRLAIPERHAGLLLENATIEIETSDAALGSGRLTKIYPEIDNGRVIADVEVRDLPTAFVNRRLLVRVQIGERAALLLPRSAVASRFGIDYVTLRSGEQSVERAVVISRPFDRDGIETVEILTGVYPGEEIELK